MASPNKPFDIERMMADDLRAQQFRRDHPDLLNKVKVGDYARRRNGTKVRRVTAIRNGRVWLQTPGTNWHDWESLEHVVLVCRAEDAEVPDAESAQS